MEAAYFFHDDVVRLLLVHGASPDLLCKEGYTAKEICSSPSICEMLDDYDGFRTKYKSENSNEKNDIDNSTIGAKWMLSAGAQKLLAKEKNKRNRNIFSLDYDDDDDDDLFKGLLNSNVDIFRDSTFHINGGNSTGGTVKIHRIYDGDDEGSLPTYKELEEDSSVEVRSSEGQKTNSSGKNKPLLSPNSKATLVGGTIKSEHRLLGDLPSLDISPTGNRRMQNMKDEEEIEKWRKKRKQELIERAAKNAEKKRQKEKRRQRRQYKEAIEKSDSIPAEFTCPLTMKLMKHPVSTPYGQTYEAAAIVEYINDYQNRCPKTGQPLSKVDLTEDKRLIKKITKWKKEFKKEFKKTVSPPGKKRGNDNNDNNNDIINNKEIEKNDYDDVYINNNKKKEKKLSPKNMHRKKEKPKSIIVKKVESPKNENDILESAQSIKFHSSPTNDESKYNDNIQKFETEHFKHVDNDNEDDEYDFD